MHDDATAAQALQGGPPDLKPDFAEEEPRTGPRQPFEGIRRITPLPLSELWRQLSLGTLFLTDVWHSETTCAVLAELRPPGGREIPGDHLDELRRILTGELQKSVAIQAKLSVSTVSSRCAELLRTFGAQRVTSRAPLLLMMAAHAASGADLAPARTREVEVAGRPHWMITATRPDLVADNVLSPSERAVFSLFLEGSTHEQIACATGKSNRTVANQLASAYRKLGSSGRAAIVARLLAMQAIATAPACSNPCL